MFSQELINLSVTIEIIVGLVAIGALAVYGIYKLIDYLWFCHKLKGREDVDTFEKNPLK